MKTKRCSKCGKVKSESEFNKNRTTKNGLGSECRECAKKYNREWRKNNPEYDKKYQLNNAKRIKEYKRKWYKNNIERIKEKQRKYHQIKRESLNS